MGDIEFNIDLGSVDIGIDHLTDKLEAALLMYTKTGATMMEAYMKKNREWHDWTSNARNGLTGRGEKVDDGYMITLAHSVNYGVSLELGHAAKYAIILPTLKAKGAEVLKGFKILSE